MEVFRRAALGRLSEISPTPGNQATDALVRAVFYTESERAALFAQLPAPVQDMYSYYVEGVNAHLQQVLQNTSLLPVQLAQLMQAGLTPQAWTVDDVVAVTQFFMRRFGGYGGEEVDRFLQCQALGAEFIRTFYPLNDPAAPTTIASGLVPPPADYHVTNVLAEEGDCPSFALPSMGKQSAAAAVERRQSYGAAAGRSGIGDLSTYIAGGAISVGGIHVPESLGSFGVTLDGSRTASGNVMHFAAPQLGPPLPPQEPFISGSATGLAVPHEVEIWDRAGDLHVAGMAIAGIPGVIIGRSSSHAWTLTSGNSDNTDVYVEIKTGETTYLYAGNPARPFEVPQPGTVRSVHGPVVAQIPAGTLPGVDAPLAIALKFTFWEKELEMAHAFYDVWKAASRNEFEAALERVPMSFNVLYADDDQNTGYWHVGLYQNRKDGVDPRFPHLGVGTQEWQGFIPFADLPKLVNPPGGIMANWNNKPADWWSNGDRANWVTTDTDAFDTSGMSAEQLEALALDAQDSRAERTTRLTVLTAYLESRASMTYAEFKAIPLQLEDAFGSYSAENLAPGLAFLDGLIVGDRGTYQQATEFLRRPDRGVRTRDENLAPPGQSGFISVAGVPDPHFGDQWPLNVAGELKEMLFGASFPDVTPPVCGPVTHSGSALRMRLLDSESGIASLRFVVPQGTASYRTTDGEIHGPFAHQETVEVAGHPAQLDAESDRGSDMGGMPLVVQVTNGAGATRACVAHPEHGNPNRSARRGARLGPNRPNPFNPSTTIQFDLSSAEHVRLEIYDVLGRRVRTLLNAELAAGLHEARWDGQGADGRTAAAGVYFYRLAAGGVVEIRSMTLAK